MLRRVLAKSKSATMMKQSASLSQRASMSTSHAFDISGSYEVSLIGLGLVWFFVQVLYAMSCHVVPALALALALVVLG